MRPSSRRNHLTWAALLAPLASLAAPAAASAQGALALARLSLVERKVELTKKGATWQAAVEGGPLQIGEALRTGPDAVARLELPWMALTLGPGSTLRFPDAFLLSASLEGGRALVEAQGRDALKVVTDGGRGPRPGPRRGAPPGQGDARHLPRRAVPRPGRRVHRHPRRGPGHGRPLRPRAVRARGRAGAAVRAACGPGRTRSTRPRESPWSCAGRATRRATRSSCCRWARTSCSSSATSPPRPRGSRCPGRAPSAGASRPGTGAGLEGMPSEDGLIAVDAK